MTEFAHWGRTGTKWYQRSQTAHGRSGGPLCWTLHWGLTVQAERHGSRWLHGPGCYGEWVAPFQWSEKIDRQIVGLTAECRCSRYSTVFPHPSPHCFAAVYKTYSYLWLPYGIGQTIYIFMLWFVLLSFFYSSPNLSRRKLDVCHTSTHGVALVRI